METLDILAEGRPVGTAEITEEGLYLRFTADCEDPLSGPCRLVGVGERGELRLGVPEPEGGRLRLSRALSRRDCAAVGRLSHLELRAPVGSSPQWEPLPPEAFREGWIRGRLRREREVLFARRGGDLRGGPALRPGEALPLAGAFLPGPDRPLAGPGVGGLRL